jgi:hypothetical protein
LGTLNPRLVFNAAADTAADTAAAAASDTVAAAASLTNNKALPETSHESSFHALSPKLLGTKQSPPPQPENNQAFSALNFASHKAPLYTSISWIPNRNQAE